MAEKVPLVHYVARDPGGPIKQSRRVAGQAAGATALRAVICSGEDLRVPCQPNRPYLSRGVGKGRKFRLLELFLAVGVPFVERAGPDGKPCRLELVTCPRCKASALYRRDAKSHEGGVPSHS